MEAAGTDPVRYAYDIAARYQGELVKDWFLSATAGYSIARGDYPDLKSGSLGLSHRWGRVNATVNYTYLDPAPRADHRIGLTVSLPVGRRQRVAGRVDSDRNRIFADYDLQGFEGLDRSMGTFRWLTMTRAKPAFWTVNITPTGSGRPCITRMTRQAASTAR